MCQQLTPEQYCKKSLTVEEESGKEIELFPMESCSEEKKIEKTKCLRVTVAHRALLKMVELGKTYARLDVFVWQFAGHTYLQHVSAWP